MTENDEHEVDGSYAELLSKFDEALSGEIDWATFSAALRDSPESLLAKFFQTKSCLETLEKQWPRAIEDSFEFQTEHVRGIVLDRFELIQEIGRGGGGVVYEARDPQTNRIVALKTPHPWMLRSELRERFILEAQTTSKLEHPNILSVLQVVDTELYCCIATELCEGPTLEEWLQEKADALEIIDAASLIIILANATSCAHEAGILHRDLKPANVLLMPATQTQLKETKNTWKSFVPKLADFGLAKILQADGAKTRTGAMLGTAAYMAPEQAFGHQDRIGSATDVYSLGVILYEMLTGRCPFRGANDIETITKSATEMAPRPTRLRTDISRDMEAICMKCLRKEPSQRYDRPADLADDLTRFIEGKTVRAEYLNGAGTTPTMLRRRTLLTAAFAGGLAGIVSYLYFLMRRAENESPETLLYLTEFHQRFVSELQTIWSHFHNNKLKLTQQRIAQADIPIQFRSRFEWRYLERLSRGGNSYFHANGNVRTLATSPDQRFIAVGMREGEVSVYQLDSKDEVAHWKTGSVGIHQIALTDTTLFALDEAGDLMIWQDYSTSDRRLIKSVRGREWSCIDIAPTHDQILLGSMSGNLQLWDVEMVVMLWEIKAHRERINAVAFSRDGMLVATGSNDAYVKVWKPYTAVPFHTQFIRSPSLTVAFSSDGKRLASGGSFNQILDIAKNEMRTVIPGHENTVCGIGFSPDDDLLFSASADRTVRAFQTDDGDLSHVYRGHTEPIRAFTAIDDARGSFLTGSKTGVVQHWNIEERQEYRSIAIEGGSYVQAAFFPNETRIAIAAHLRFEIRDVVDGRLLASHAIPHSTTSLSISSNGRFAALCANGEVVLLSLEGGIKTQPVEFTGNNWLRCCFSPDSQSLLVCRHESDAVMYDLVSKEAKTIPGKKAISFSPDGKHIAMQVDEPGHAIGIWDVARQEIVSVLRGHAGYLIDLSFDSQGQILSASADGTARLWDLKSGKERFIFSKHVDSVNRALFSPDFKTIVSCGQDGNINLWDAFSGFFLYTLAKPSGPTYSCDFSFNGEHLVADFSPRKGTGGVVIWDAD